MDKVCWVTDVTNYVKLFSPETKTIITMAKAFSPESAARIVACLNACEGLPTENLIGLEPGEIRSLLVEAMDAVYIEFAKVSAKDELVLNLSGRIGQLLKWR